MTGKQPTYNPSGIPIMPNTPHETTMSPQIEHSVAETLSYGSPTSVADYTPWDEKHLETIEAQPVDVDSPIGSNSPTSGKVSVSQPKHIAWRPSLFRASPLVGIAALILSFLQIVASYAVLKASDGDAVSSWKYQPTVYLAILTAISNKALAFAVVQGTVVTFWLRALRGTTLGQLHRDWGYGLHVYKSLMAGRHFNLLALACICATFVAIDGPLLQRASSVRLKVPKEPVSLSVSITPQIPAYFSGQSTWEYWPLPILGYQNRFLPVVRGYASSTPIKDAITGCTGRCRVTVLAPALEVEQCHSELEYHNYTKPVSRKMTKLIFDGCDGVDIPQRQSFFTAFGTQNGTEENPAERLMLETGITDDAVTDTCIGHLNKTRCTLVSAIAEYPVLVDNGVITFAESISHPKIFSRANNTSLSKEAIRKFGLYNSTNDIYKTTLSGIALAAQMKYLGSEALVAGFGGVEGQPTVAPMPDIFTWNFQTNFDRWNDGFDCAPAWRNPMDEIMAALNEIMFRTGVYAAQTFDDDWLKSNMDDRLEINSTVEGTPQTASDVFHSDMRWFAGAASVELFSILIMMFTFYGWWRLGRSVTFSPLEIAKAFDAPLLDDVASNHNGREINNLEGAKRIQYGILNDETETNEESGYRRAEKIVMADEERVHKPTGKRMSLEEYYSTLKAHASQIRFRHRGKSN